MVENSTRCSRNVDDEKVSNPSYNVYKCYHFKLLTTFSVNSFYIGSFLFLTQIIPTGIAWIPNLMKTITEVVSNGSKGIKVDKKLIDGPNPDQRGKWLIPLIAAFQVRI